MKLSEYAADLLAVVKLYGDLEVVEEHPQAPDFVRRSVRAPRLCRVAVVKGGMSRGLEVHCPSDNAIEHCHRHRAELTGERVYVI